MLSVDFIFLVYAQLDVYIGYTVRLSVSIVQVMVKFHMDVTSYHHAGKRKRNVLPSVLVFYLTLMGCL